MTESPASAKNDGSLRLDCTHILRSDFFFGCFHEHLAAIIHIAFAIHIGAMIQVPLAGSGAGSNLGRAGLVMRSALTLALLRCSTLGMCHCLLILISAFTEKNAAQWQYFFAKNTLIVFNI